MGRPRETSKLKRWNVTTAIEEAKKEGVDMTRPTVIRLCRDAGVGYQPTGLGGNWIIYPDRFMALIKGDVQI